MQVAPCLPHASARNKFPSPHFGPAVICRFVTVRPRIANHCTSPGTALIGREFPQRRIGNSTRCVTDQRRMVFRSRKDAVSYAGCRVLLRQSELVHAVFRMLAAKIFKDGSYN